MWQWIRDHAEFVLSIFMSIILSGVIGFFSAVLSIKSEMGDVQDKVAKLEAQMGTTVAKIPTLDKAVTDIAVLQRDVGELRALSEQRTQLVSIITEGNARASDEAVKAVGVLFEAYVRSHPEFLTPSADGGRPAIKTRGKHR